MIPKQQLTATYNLLSEMYNEKDESKYNELMKGLDSIGKELPVDLYREWRGYVKARVEKQLQYKKPKWEKAKSGTGTKTWPVKSSYIFREDEGQAFIALANALTEYFKSKTN